MLATDRPVPPGIWCSPERNTLRRTRHSPTLRHLIAMSTWYATERHHVEAQFSYRSNTPRNNVVSSRSQSIMALGVGMCLIYRWDVMSITGVASRA